MGEITAIKYNGSTDFPTAVGDYTVTIDLDAGTNYIATTDLELGSYSITPALPTPYQLDFYLGDVYYNGYPQSVTVTPGYGVTGSGEITVKYNGSTVVPVLPGEYAVTVDITAGDNYEAITDLSLGAYTIAPGIPTPFDLDFMLDGVTYDGQPQPVPVAVRSDLTGSGKITAIRYNGSTDVPTSAGAYAVTVDIDAGEYYAAIAGLPLGSFTIAPAVPTPFALDFELGDVTADGKPHPVTVTPGADITGLGEITILYNGSTTVPTEPGEYTVTVDIAAGANYTAIAGRMLGTFIILAPSTPVARYSVQLPFAVGLTTSPSAGSYEVNSGANFTFTLTPAIPLPDGTPPQVQTNRVDAPEDYLRLTTNADGTYTVVIIGIRQDIEITLSMPTDNEFVADAAAGLKVYTVPGAIAVVNSRPAPATVYVYNLGGTLVRLTKVPPGSARLSVTPGVYIVTDGGAFRRKVAVLR
ncbi:MAG: MBG domain-containing protein [Tannerella sp.]|nr:MBG domain-containing protein [Tannerella sp.]